MDHFFSESIGFGTDSLIGRFGSFRYAVMIMSKYKQNYAGLIVEFTPS